MKKEKRFEVVYKESGAWNTEQILVDRMTGVNYLVLKSGYGTSITPLLDAEGKPIIRKHYDL